MADTKIEWTDAVWNPVRGCTRVSPGCERCYAERTAMRFSGPGMPYEGLVQVANGHPQWTGRIALIEEKLAEPLRWRKPKRVFVNSMSDLFHEGVPFEFIAAVFGFMALAPQHQFQILTKRPARMREYFAARPRGICIGGDVNLNPLFQPWPLANVWLGTSVEDQRRADERIPLLLQCPAAVRFVSAEPLLGPVDLTRWLRIAWKCSGCRNFYPDPYQQVCPDCGRTGYWSGSHEFNPPGRQRGSGIDWLITGGESGPGARPCDVEWIRSLVAQCQSAGVACFVKQVGSRPAGLLWHVNDRKGGDWDEWTDDLRVREFPEPHHAR